MSLLENICAHCGMHSIKELEIKNLTDALIYFKGIEEYSNLLSVYTFDENKVSEELINDMANLLLEGKAMYTRNDNSIFITMNDSQIDEAYKSTSPEDSKTIHSMLSDYRKYNTEKGKVKEKSLV